MVIDVKIRVKRITAAVIILFFIIPASGIPQCQKHFILNQPVSIEGVTNGIDHYYQNLVVQDIALAGQQAFSEISLRFNYKIHYIVDFCKPGQLEIRVLPLNFRGYPLIYRGYNIASSVKPEKADLIFQITDHNGFVTDSVIFFDIPLEKDSNLYTLLISSRNDTDTNISVAFARASFHYTRSSYEEFRDRILQIDQYYAASLIADSALIWARKGFLSESGMKPEMILRQYELERISEYIRPDRFDSVLLPGQHDLAGLSSKFHELVRLNNRFGAIINYDRFESTPSLSAVQQKDLMTDYLDMLDHYYEMAFQNDFSFINFIEGLSRPDFSNAVLLDLHEMLNRQQGIDTSGLRSWCSVFIRCLIERGDNYMSSGNQLRALTYYESAFNLSRLINLHEYQAIAYRQVGMMKSSIADSYAEISKKSALKDNPVMAAQYFKNARDLFSGKDFKSFEPASLQEFEKWLYPYFESRVISLISLGDYGKALVYLNEIQSYCLIAPSYPCPDQFHVWMGIVRNGIYHELLDKARSLMAGDELQEAEQAYRQAVETRMRAGYRVNKESTEEDLARSFRQFHYDDLIEEGRSYFAKEEFNNALYYFNKASFEERKNILRPDTGLPGDRQESARRVIEGLLSDGRVKTWAFDFEGAGIALGQVKSMLSEYRIAESDTLSAQYAYLQAYFLQNECELIFRKYNELMAGVENARQKNQFILAMETADKAVAMSLEHMNCRIRDDDAWYQKMLLESPANFQKKEIEIEGLTHGECSVYLNAFMDLKNYYYRNRLLEQGVVFIPLNERVIKASDAVFLEGILDYYINTTDLENAFKILERLRETGCSEDLLADQQKSLAALLARRDATIGGSEMPWYILDSYTGQDKWYRTFNWSYKITWLKTEKWKLSYWPFIWKK